MFAFADIKGIAITYRMTLAIDMHDAQTADVENAKFPPLGEGVGPQLFRTWQFELRRKRNSGADDGAVQIDVDELDAVRFKKVFEKKGAAQLRRRHAGKTYFVRHL